MDGAIGACKKAGWIDLTGLQCAVLEKFNVDTIINKIPYIYKTVKPLY